MAVLGMLVPLGSSADSRALAMRDDLRGSRRMRLMFDRLADGLAEHGARPQA